jgi:hypothetical protein
MCSNVSNVSTRQVLKLCFVSIQIAQANQINLENNGDQGRLPVTNTTVEMAKARRERNLNMATGVAGRARTGRVLSRVPGVVSLALQGWSRVAWSGAGAGVLPSHRDTALFPEFFKQCFRSCADPADGQKVSEFQLRNSHSFSCCQVGSL